MVLQGRKRIAVLNINAIVKAELAKGSAVVHAKCARLLTCFCCLHF